MRVDLVAAVAANIVANVAHGAPNAVPAAHGVAAGDVFAQILAALGHQVADANAPALLQPANPDSPAAVPAPSTANAPANDAVTGVNLQTLIAALSNSAAKPAKVPTDVAKLLVKAPAEKAAATTAGVHAVPASEPAADPNSVLTQFVAAAQPVPAQPAPAQLVPAQPTPATPTPPATAPAVAAAAAQDSVPTDILAAATVPTDKTASPIVPNGTTVKPSRSARGSETTITTDATKSQSQGSSASVLAALSTAASRTFSNQPATNILPLHPTAEHAADNKPSTSATNGQSSTAHDAAVTASVPAAAPATPAIQPIAPPQTSSTEAPAPPPADAGVVAAGNGIAANGATANTSPAPLQVNLQFHHASATTPPDATALAVTIAAKSQDGIKHFDIRLDPPELGRVDVRLTLDDAGKAQASLTVEKPQTLELLQKDSTNLERALKDAGLDLSQNGLNFSLKGQQQQSGDGNSPSTRGRAVQVRAIATVDASPTILSTSGVSASDTRLDIRV